MSSRQDHDNEAIPNLPTVLISSDHFNVRTWFLSIFDSVLIGFFGGWASIGFYYLIQLVTWLFFMILVNLMALDVAGTNLTYIFLPAIGGAIIGLVMMRYAPEVRGEGIPEVMKALTLKNVTIRKRIGLSKAIASAITIGSGGSAGREGPVAQIGSSVGSTIAQVFKLDRSRARLLIICGFAAGLAGMFNAPLGSALFAIEVLGGTLVALDVVPVFIAAAVSAVVHRWILGPAPMFANASMGSFNLPEYWFIIILGLILGVIAVFWHSFFTKTRRVVDRIKIASKYKPILGGIVTGCVGIFFVNEGIFGLGHEGIEGALLLQYSLGLLFLLAFAKMVATAFTLTTGGSGGLFQPTLYIGTMLGGGFGLLFAAMSPQLVTDPSLYAIIGMGAMFAGASQCPIATIIMIPELTGNYNLLFPQLVASMISYIVFRLAKRGSSIYTTKLEQKDISLKTEI
jgi:chloride channel protein, CIC family